MLKKRIESFGYAIKGISTLFSTQINARIHGIVLIIVVLMGFYYHINGQEWAIITLTSAMVLSAEAMNTAIEFVVDMVSPDYHILAEKAKDVAAAAVLLAAIGAIIVGLLIFLPKIELGWLN